MWEPKFNYLPCRCFCAEHFVRVGLDPDVPDEVTVDIVSSRNGSIWHRIKWAFIHVFGREDLVMADLMLSRKQWHDAVHNPEVSDLKDSQMRLVDALKACKERNGETE